MNKNMMVLILALLGLSLVACSKKPPVVTEPVSQEKPAKTVAAAPVKNSGEDEMARLEGERRKLEQLMNQIMSNEIYFEYDRAVLTNKAYEILVQVGDILKKEPRLSLQIEGHTDERGTESYNMTLGDRRANSVKSYLVNYGVPADRLTGISFGEEKPKAEGRGESAWSQNRRAAFQVNIL